MIELKDDIYRRAEPIDPALLAELGVAADSVFAEFYGRYEGAFGSRNPGFTLLDIDGGVDDDAGGSVVSGTRLVRQRFSWPRRYLVLTDMLAHGVYAYDTELDKVFKVDFEGGDEDLIAGRLEPEFESFEAFLRWFLDGEY